MKICFLANGSSVHTQRWILPLRDLGHRIHLVSYARVLEAIPGVETVDLTRRTNAPKLRFVAWAWWLRQYLARIQPDVLHAHQVQAAGWLGAMSRYHPFVVSGWGSDILVEPHKSWLRRMLVNRVLQASDRLIVPSQPMAHAAIKLGYPAAKLRYIPWGIEAEVFCPTPMDRLATRRRLGVEEDAKVILSPRGIAPVYNQDILLEAIHSLPGRFPNLLLLLLRFNVDPSTAARLEAKVTALGLDPYVRWLPPQTPAEMAQLYRMADVVVSIPSSEGYGFSVYEAMAAGCPTLISDLPVFAVELTDGVHALKTPVRDVIATRERLRRLLNDTVLGQTMRQEAFAVVQAHHVSRRVAAAEALYRELQGWRQNHPTIAGAGSKTAGR